MRTWSCAGWAERTRETDLAAVTGLAKHYRRSPDQITDEEVQAYLLYLIGDRQRSWNTCHVVVHGLRFPYHTTLKRDRTTFSIPSMRPPGKLPAILSREARAWMTPGWTFRSHTRPRSFDEIFSRIARSDTLATIWYEAYGDDYPEDASPFSVVTAPELISMGRALAVSEGRRFVDIACGQRGPSLFVARVTGAAAVGIDSSYVAAKLATATAGKRGVADKARFIVADATATGVQAASMHGALSIDALQLMPHRDAVLLEVSQILKPGGRFAFSTWLARQPGKGPPLPDFGRRAFLRGGGHN